MLTRPQCNCHFIGRPKNKSINHRQPWEVASDPKGSGPLVRNWCYSVPAGGARCNAFLAGLIGCAFPSNQYVWAKGTEYPNEILGNFSGVNHKLYYRLFICSGNPNVAANWKFHSATSKNRVLHTGMESHQPYRFRVVAVGAAGASPKSDYATAKAA